MASKRDDYRAVILLKVKYDEIAELKQMKVSTYKDGILSQL